MSAITRKLENDVVRTLESGINRLLEFLSVVTHVKPIDALTPILVSDTLAPSLTCDAIAISEVE